MAEDRISLRLEKEGDSEPFITRADYLKEQQDKSLMPWPDDDDVEAALKRSKRSREQKQPQSRSRKRRRRRTERRKKRQERTSRRSRSTQDREKKTPDPDKVEQQAVQKVVRQLKEKGASDAFIKENMDAIRERVRRELQ